VPFTRLRGGYKNFNLLKLLMKKLAFTAKTLCATILIGSLVACGSAGDSAVPAADSTGKAPEAKATLNIRYIDADSVSANYALAKEFQEQALQSLNKIESVRQSRASEIQKLGASIEQKARNNGYLTQTSYEGDMNALAKKQQDAAQTLENMENRARQEMAQRQVELNDSLESFIKDYNARKGYDAILYKAAGVYFNPSLDITKEVIEGLNARYEKTKKSK